MQALIGLLLLAAIAGIIYPYIKNTKRWHFLLAFFGLAILAGATAPEPTSEQKAAKAAQEKKEQTEEDAKQKKEQAEEEANPYADTGKQMAWIRISKDAVRAKLKDPDSADFRDVNFYAGGGTPVACGEVNAKNGFGGYTGYEPFLAAGDQLVVLSSEMESGKEFAKVWNKFCKN